MEYQDLNSTLIDSNGVKSPRKIVSLVLLTLVFLIIIIVLDPAEFFRKQSKIEGPKTFVQAKELKSNVENSSTIECQREFFLFHQDYNHVCEVTGVVIKNVTLVTIIGNANINVLYIFNFEVYKLPNEIFKKFLNLKHLVVNGNHVQLLEMDTFDGAENLEVLRLSNNDLKELPPFVLKSMRNLKTLDFGRNKIERIESDSFVGLNSLERLYLSDNSLKFISSTAFSPLRKLVSLSIENNQINELDGDIFKQNKLLRSLGISNNTFKDLHNDIFRYFGNLTDLSVSELRINSLNLNGTKNIQTLVLRNTDIVNVTLSNFPKILVSYGTNIELMSFVIDESTVDFSKIPNWGGIYYNSAIRFLFYFKKELALIENIESYDNVVRKHFFLQQSYKMSDGSEYVAVEYKAVTQT